MKSFSLIKFKKDNSIEKILIFGEKDDAIFNEHNQKGFNVYQSVNSFCSTSRKIKNLYKYISIGIDYDLPKEEDGSYNKINSTIKEVIKNKVGFYPTKINETFKGYHIWFNLEDSLNYLSEESYDEIYNWFNNRIGGDKKMKSTTGILKIEGYLDKKEDRADFIIKTIYNEQSNIITKEEVKQLGFNLNYREIEEVEKLFIKSQKKEKRNHRNFEDLKTLDALELVEVINKLNTTNSLFEKRVEITKVGNSYSVDDTSGLKIEFDETYGKWKFTEYSGKNRDGVWGFFHNYYSKFVKAPTPKELKDKIGTMYRLWIKMVDSGISLNTGIDKLPVPQNLIINISNGDFKSDVTNLNEIHIKDEGEVLFFDDLIYDFYGKVLNNMYNYNYGTILKLLFGAIKYCIVNKKDRYGEMIIPENEIISILGISSSQTNKELLRKTLIEMKALSFIEDGRMYTDEGNLIETKEVKSVFTTKIGIDRKTKQIYYVIKNNLPYKTLIYIPENILSLDAGIGDTRKTLLAIYTFSKIKKFTKAHFSQEELINLLEITSKDNKQINSTIRIALKSQKTNKIIHGYERTKSNTYYIW